MTDHKTLAAALAAFQAEVPHVKKDKTAQVRSDKGSYCIAPETKVLTHDLRWMEAHKVAVGDRLVAFDEMPSSRLRCRRWRSADVLNSDTVALPTYRVHLADGTTLVASETHRWLTINSSQATAWVDTKDLRTARTKRAISSHPSHLFRATDMWDEERSHELGYLAGAFDGEGSLVQTAVKRSDGRAPRDQTYQLHCLFCQRDNEMKRAVDGLLAHFGFAAQEGRLGGSNGDVHNLRIAGGRAEVLRFLGQVRPLRLLARFEAERLGTFRCKDRVEVVEVEYLGVQELVAMKTSTGTFVADGFASHNSYTYADLADVTAAALPALAKHGLSFSCKPTLDEAGNFVLAYTLRHAGSDETDSGSYPLPKAGTPQQVGSAISYGRRYVLSAVTGIVADEDDDGKAGGEALSAQPQRGRQHDTKPPADTPDAARTVLRNRAKAMDLPLEAVAAEYQRRAGTGLKDEKDPRAIRGFIASLDDGTVTIPQPEPAGT